MLVYIENFPKSKNDSYKTLTPNEIHILLSILSIASRDVTRLADLKANII
jgi:hypothetical protein